MEHGGNANVRAASTALRALLSSVERNQLQHDARASAERRELNGLFAELWLSGDRDYSHIRELVGSYFWQSPQIRRCYEKPRGYAGDYLMMDFICNRPPPASTALGRWVDGWFGDDFPGTQSVRNRRDYMAQLLASEHAKGARRVLNVACGGAPEFARLPKAIDFEEVVLLDQDADALAFAQESIAAAHGSQALTRIKPVCARIRSILDGSYRLGVGRFDVIYSMGLYDYLLHDVANVLTQRLWQALAPGGMIVIGNYQGDHWGRYVVEALMDWFLIYRDRDKLQALANALPGASSRVTTESTGLVHLLHITKQRGDSYTTRSDSSSRTS